MSEERIKERCKREDIALKIVKGFLEKECYTDTELYYSLNTLLDLYNKQKEEIKELKEISKMYDSYIGEKMPINSKIIIADRDYFINGTFVDNYISKNIIRKIIKELSDQNYNNYELSIALSKSLEALLK